MEGRRWAIFQPPSGRDRAAYPVHFTTAVYNLAYGDDIDTFLSQYATAVTHEMAAELVRVAKLLVEFYAYRIAFERMDNSQ